jgi:two-component system cell cycle response regulator
MKYVPFVLVTCLLVHGHASGQTPEQLTEQLRGQTGADRARTLAALTDALRHDQPAAALSYGQEAITLFAQHPDPEWEVRTLNEMAWAFMTLSDYTNAVAFARRGRDLAERHDDKKGRARAVNNLGVIAQRRGDVLEAIDYFEESLNAYRELRSDLEIANALNNLGFVYSTALADYETALSHHIEALDVRQKIGDKAAIALSLNNIGIVYHRLGDLDRALSHYQQSLAIRREIGGDNRIAATLHNIGDLYMDRADYAQALETHAEALERRRKIGDRTGITQSLRSIGLIHHALGTESEARRHLNEALQMAIAIGDRSIVAQARLGLAVVDRERGAHQRSIAHAREALAIAEHLRNLDLTRRALEQLAASQEESLDHVGALATFRRFHDVNARIFNEERGRRLEQLDRKYQAQHREAELAALRAQQALQLSEQAIIRHTVLAGAGAVGFAGFALYRRRVESTRLAERLSVTDTLTGLKNRRFVLQTIGSDVSVATRKHRVADKSSATSADLLFMLIDVDNFKAVNDRYGHAAGDHVLVQIAEVLRTTCRTSDTLARWGGEEFLAILRFCNRNTAPISAERIRMAIEKHVFDIGGQRVSVTCSVGFASFPVFPDRPDEVGWERVVALADEALYRAKQAGRNTWAGPDHSALASAATRSTSAVHAAWQGQHRQFHA